MALFSAAIGAIGAVRTVGGLLKKGRRTVARNASSYANFAGPITGLPPGAGTPVTRRAEQVAAVKAIDKEGDVLVDLETGEVVKKKRRRRRRRLLTCADRADISFITATLGKGAMGQQAIAALLARCN